MLYWVLIAFYLINKQIDQRDSNLICQHTHFSITSPLYFPHLFSHLRRSQISTAYYRFIAFSLVPRPHAAALHLLEEAPGLDGAYEEHHFEGLDIRAGGDQVFGLTIYDFLIGDFETIEHHILYCQFRPIDGDFRHLNFRNAIQRFRDGIMRVFLRAFGREPLSNRTISGDKMQGRRWGIFGVHAGQAGKLILKKSIRYQIRRFTVVQQLRQPTGPS